MRLRLVREPSAGGATIGALYVNGVFECWSLEDVIREVPGQPVAEWKVATKTAIPAGVYRVIITFSNRFKRLLPLLVNVSGFSGIRIHPGNTAADTDGCVLVGQDRGPARVGVSRVAFEVLMEKLVPAVDAGDVFISVENPK